MEVVIIWFICGFICSVIAGTKGRSPGGFFLMGLFLGPFGILLALVLPRDEKEREKELIVSGQMKKCPMCAEMIKSEALKCRYCGSDLMGAKNKNADIIVSAK